MADRDRIAQMLMARSASDIPAEFSGGLGDWQRYLRNVGGDGGDGGSGGGGGGQGGGFSSDGAISSSGTSQQGGNQQSGGNQNSQQGGGQFGQGQFGQFTDVATGGTAPVGSSFMGGGNPLTAEQLLESQGVQQGPANPTVGVDRGGYLDNPNSQFANPVTDVNQAFPGAPNNPANNPFEYFNPDSRDALSAYNAANPAQINDLGAFSYGPVGGPQSALDSPFFGNDPAGPNLGNLDPNSQEQMGAFNAADAYAQSGYGSEYGGSVFDAGYGAGGYGDPSGSVSAAELAAEEAAAFGDYGDAYGDSAPAGGSDPDSDDDDDGDAW